MSKPKVHSTPFLGTTPRSSTDHFASSGSDFLGSKGRSSHDTHQCWSRFSRPVFSPWLFSPGFLSSLGRPHFFQFVLMSILILCRGALSSLSRSFAWGWSRHRRKANHRSPLPSRITQRYEAPPYSLASQASSDNQSLWGTSWFTGHTSLPWYVAPLKRGSALCWACWMSFLIALAPGTVEERWGTSGALVLPTIPFLAATLIHVWSSYVSFVRPAPQDRSRHRMLRFTFGFSSFDTLGLVGTARLFLLVDRFARGLSVCGPRHDRHPATEVGVSLWPAHDAVFDLFGPSRDVFFPGSNLVTAALVNSCPFHCGSFRLCGSLPCSPVPLRHFAWALHLLVFLLTLVVLCTCGTCVLSTFVPSPGSVDICYKFLSCATATGCFVYLVQRQAGLSGIRVGEASNPGPFPATSDGVTTPLPSSQDRDLIESVVTTSGPPSPVQDPPLVGCNPCVAGSRPVRAPASRPTRVCSLSQPRLAARRPSCPARTVRHRSCSPPPAPASADQSSCPPTASPASSGS